MKQIICLLFAFSLFNNRANTQSTASPHVTVMDSAFRIPELDRNRRIWIYVPQQKEGERFPVLYLQDGQNMFDARSSFAGEWGIDEFMDSTALPKCIVVAIDNGGVKRINEYAPFDMSKYGKGEGDAYLHFIVEKLKPFIDSHYPVLRKRENTWIGGSSMGGLISFYALLKYPKVFGSAAVFSPSFWIAPPLLDLVPRKIKKCRANIYFYVGKQEGETMVTDMMKVFDLTRKQRKIKATVVIREEGKHNEAAWRKEFPLYYEWQQLHQR